MSFLSKFKSFKVSVMIEKVIIIIIMKCEISIQVLSKLNLRLIIYNNSLKVKLTRLHTVIMKCNQPTPINSLNLCRDRKGKLFQMY